MALKTPLPLPEEEGVEVDMGFSEYGKKENPIQEQLSPPPPTSPAISAEKIKENFEKAVDEKLVEQINDEVPALLEKPETKKAEEPSKIAEPEKLKPEIKQDVTVEEKAEKIVKPEPKPVIDPRLLYTGKKEVSTEGNDEVKGDKGIEEGTLDAEKYKGPGGKGENGISYNLGDRKASTLPKPSYNSDDQGRVNVSIWVDRNGKVIRAEVLQKGTTVADISLKNMAKQAALRAFFAPDNEAPEIQKGTITYNFIKLN